MNVSSPYCVSVVVPTYKRPELLHRCLTALVAQDIAPTAYEIIVVDDAACAETRQEIEAWAACLEESGHTLRYIPITGTHGPAVARNVGWRAATGEIIAFTDDDCLPDHGWLRAGVAAFTADVIGVSGRLIVPLRYSLAEKKALFRFCHRLCVGVFKWTFLSASPFPHVAPPLSCCGNVHHIALDPPVCDLLAHTWCHQISHLFPVNP